jgi:hypothetical protein
MADFLEVSLGWVALSRCGRGSVLSAQGSKPLPSWRLTVPPASATPGRARILLGTIELMRLADGQVRKLPELSDLPGEAFRIEIQFIAPARSAFSR